MFEELFRHSPSADAGTFTPPCMPWVGPALSNSWIAHILKQKIFVYIYMYISIYIYISVRFTPIIDAY